MFWLPRKTIYTGPKKQRGNIVFGVGLPPKSLPDVTGGPGGDWELIQFWNTNLGDMAGIETAFSNNTRGQGFVWSPDGTKLTMGSTSADQVKTFSCSTPFDPDTASEIASINLTNPYIQGSTGSRIFINVVVGDVVQNHPFTNYIIGSGGASSDFAKSDWPQGGSGDGPSTFPQDASYVMNAFTDILWYGSTPGGNLDALAGQTSHFNGAISVNLSTGFSPITDDGLRWYQGIGSQGIRFWDLTNPVDPSTLTYGAPQALPGGSGIRPSACWFNPLDTSRAWVQGDLSGGMQLAVFDTKAQF